MAQVPHGPGGATRDSSSDGLPPRERVLAMAAIALAMTMAVLDGAIVNVALPVMAKDLAVKPADAIFVVNAYQVAVTPSAAKGSRLAVTAT
jgi:DHA2 family multidrug resistance protein-like MFS transporter